MAGGTVKRSLSDFAPGVDMIYAPLVTHETPEANYLEYGGPLVAAALHDDRGGVGAELLESRLRLVWHERLRLFRHKRIRQTTVRLRSLSG